MRSTTGKLVLVLVIVALVAPGVVAQEDDASAEPAAGAVMGAGDIDIGLGGGLGGLIYPHITPTVDVGVLPLGSIVLSAGAMVDAGYCVLCDIVTSASDWNVNSYYFAVLGRAMVHIRDLAEAAGPSTPLDPYAGLVAGPRFYRFVVEYEPDGDSARFNLNTIMLGPNVGAKFFFGDARRWFGFGEVRYLFEFGFESTKVEIGGVTYEVSSDDYRSGGFDFGLGVGLRL
jgi:hypothetical protein